MFRIFLWCDEYSIRSLILARAAASTETDDCHIGLSIRASGLKQNAFGSINYDCTEIRKKDATLYMCLPHVMVL